MFYIQKYENVVNTNMGLGMQWFIYKPIYVIVEGLHIMEKVFHSFVSFSWHIVVDYMYYKTQYTNPALQLQPAEWTRPVTLDRHVHTSCFFQGWVRKGLPWILYNNDLY